MLSNRGFGVQLKAIYANRSIVELNQQLKVSSPDLITVLAIPELTERDSSDLLKSFPGMEDNIIIYESDLDFLEIVSDEGVAKLYYALQVPGISMNFSIDNALIPAITFPIQGMDDFIIYVQTEEDMDKLYSYFAGGKFIVSWSGMLVSVLSPVPAQLETYVRQYYTSGGC
jgi:hypothetical protein